MSVPSDFPSLLLPLGATIVADFFCSALIMLFLEPFKVVSELESLRQPSKRVKVIVVSPPLRYICTLFLCTYFEY